MSEIEEAIRRQMLAEREAAARNGAAAYQQAQPRHSKLESASKQGGLLGMLAALALLLFKFGGPLVALLSKLKFLAFFKTIFLTGGTMLVSMWAWSTALGWGFGVGIVLMIFIHESGHALAARSLGLKVGAMVFVPFMGAVVTTKGAKNAREDAFIGIMGPVFGTLAGLVSLAIHYFTGGVFWLVLAWVTFQLNLFNLAPMPPLDGSWITPLLSPKLLAVGVLLLFIIAPNNPMIWILGILSIPRIIHAWRAKSTDPYYRASAADRWRYGLAYLGLAAFLGYTVSAINSEMKSVRPARLIAHQVDLDKRS